MAILILIAMPRKQGGAKVGHDKGRVYGDTIFFRLASSEQGQ